VRGEQARVRLDLRKVPLEEKVAIVTGGNSGIGRSTCTALAKQGVRVVIVGRDRSRVDETTDGLRASFGPDRALGFALDVCDENQVGAMVKLTLATYHRIDVLVTSAGILRPRTGAPRQVAEMPLEEWNLVVNTNLKGVFITNRAVLPAMIEHRRGDIINISSTSGRKGFAFDSAYCASKFGVIGLSEALAEEVKQFGVRVQCILPGAIETPIWKQNEMIPRLIPVVPADRIANVICFVLQLPKDVTLPEASIKPLRTTFEPVIDSLPGLQ